MQRPISRSIRAAVMAAGMVLPPSAAFCDAVTQGGELTATALPAGRALAVLAPEGSYVLGDFWPAGDELTLTLTSGGQDMRRLVLASGGTHEFQFMAPPQAELSIRGPEGAPFSLRLKSVVPPADQHPAAADYLSPAIAALARQATAANGAADAAGTLDTSAFWQDRMRDGTPMIEPDGDSAIVTFLYRGASRNVRLFGGPAPDHAFLDHLARTDVWFQSYRLPATTRLAYRLAPDVPDVPGTASARRRALLATAAADPLNPHTWPQDAPDAFNRWSVLELPKAPAQPGYPPLPATVEESTFPSAILGNTRRIQFFRSAGFSPQAPDALLLFVFDGPRAVSEMEVPGALQRLVAQGQLPPVAAVFIDPIDSDTRAHELPGNPAFARFMAEELLPFAAQHLGIVPKADRTILAGASYGGIGAAHVAFSYPDRFGAAISMSGSYWWAPPDTPPGALNWMADRALHAPRLPRMVITAGTFETARPEDGVTPADIRESARQLYAVMKARGADVSWHEYAGGHDSLVWRGALTEGLLDLFPPAR